MRDKLIELLTQKYDHYCDQCGVNKQSNYIENLADYLIAHGVTFAPDNNVPCKWIPVSERLPNGVDDVLVYAGYADGYHVMRGWYYPEAGEWHVNVWAGVRTGLIVTHWMPLPEPPKEDE